jgi:hypothetical protein
VAAALKNKEQTAGADGRSRRQEQTVIDLRADAVIELFWK